MEKGTENYLSNCSLKELKYYLYVYKLKNLPKDKMYKFIQKQIKEVQNA